MGFVVQLFFVMTVMSVTIMGSLGNNLETSERVDGKREKQELASEMAKLFAHCLEGEFKDCDTLERKSIGDLLAALSGQKLEYVYNFMSVDLISDDFGCNCKDLQDRITGLANELISLQGEHKQCKDVLEGCRKSCTCIPKDEL